MRDRRVNNNSNPQSHSQPNANALERNSAPGSSADTMTAIEDNRRRTSIQFQPNSHNVNNRYATEVGASRGTVQRHDSDSDEESYFTKQEVWSEVQKEKEIEDLRKAVSALKFGDHKDPVNLKSKQLALEVAIAELKIMKEKRGKRKAASIAKIGKKVLPKKPGFLARLFGASDS